MTLLFNLYIIEINFILEKLLQVSKFETHFGNET